MMAILSYFFLAINLFAPKQAEVIDLDFIRTHYHQAVEKRDLCAEMIRALEGKQQENIYLGYLGGLQAIWANHANNPVSKLSTFNQGKERIELAIKQDPQNPELRFIRLSIQQNAPFFLGYRSKIEEDRATIEAYKQNITSTLVKQNIDQLKKSNTKK